MTEIFRKSFRKISEQNLKDLLEFCLKEIRICGNERFDGLVIELIDEIVQDMDSFKHVLSSLREVPDSEARRRIVL